MCQSQSVREDRKLLKSLITHIKAGARVAITYMHLRICESTKDSHGAVIPFDFFALGEGIYSNRLMTCDTCGRNKSNCCFL